MVLDAGALNTAVGNTLFHTAALPFDEMAILAIAASLVLWAEELRKRTARHRRAPALRAEPITGAGRGEVRPVG